MKKILLVSILNLFSIISRSQLQPVSPTRPTPNSASLGQFGEVPVSMYTGVPQIDIPIHTIKTEFASLPVSISYNASGFRPDVHPSWVGMNWSLNAGGAITRTVRHLPDEYATSSTDGLNITGMGYYYSHDILAVSNWYLPEGNFVQNGLMKDREPDIFSFNFLGFSGKFFLDHTGNWKVQSDKFFKVIFDPADFKVNYLQQNCNCYYGLTRRTFNKFVLIDDKGVQYTFGTDDAIEYSVGMTAKNEFSTQYDYPSNTMATSWYLVKITSPSGEEISLGYERGPYQSALSFYQYQKGCTMGDVGGAGFLSRWGAYGNYTQGLSGSITSPVYLKRIQHYKSNTSIYFSFSKSNELKYTWPLYMEILRNVQGDLPASINDFLGFNMTNNIPYFENNPSEAYPTPGEPSKKFVWFKLDSISVSHQSSVNSHDLPNVRNYHRVQAQFNYTENSTERLKLNSVVLTGDRNTHPQSYDFSYDQTPMPGYVSEISDHWGFSNGNPLLKTALQTYASYNNLDQYRQPVQGKSLSGLLKEIRYPTGGKTVFTFENHDYSAYAFYGPGSLSVQVIAENGIAGGARIKKIENHDGLGNKTWKEYSYVTDYNPLTGSGTVSSGILEGKPLYYWTFQQGGVNSLISSSSSIVPASSTSSGRHIGYSYVTERFQDGSYKTFKYTNHDFGYKDVQPLFQWNFDRVAKVPFNSTEMERGKLLEAKTFSAANKLLTKNEIAYQRVGFSEDNFVRAVVLDYSILCAGLPDMTFPAMTSYYHYCHFFLPTSVKDYTYDEKDHVFLSEKINEYDNYGNLIKQTAQQSDGGLLETRYTYSYNYPADPLLMEMKNRNRISEPITIEKFKGATFLEGNKYNYSFFNSNSLIALSSVQGKTGSSNYFTRFSYNKYDQNGNVLEIEKPGGIKESFIYGYGSRWPVASVQGKDHVSVSAILNAGILNWPNGNAEMEQELDKLRTQLPGSLVQTATFNFYGDMESQKDVSGRKNVFNYDTRGRLTLIRDQHNNILKRYDYKYLDNHSYPYSNSVQTRTLYPSAPCQPGYYSKGIGYTVPASRYGSFISFEDANLKAIHEIETEGQAYAEANAICEPYYLFEPCCNWYSMYTRFALNQSQVEFNLIIDNGASSTAYGQIGQLNGILFLPSTSKYINVTSTVGVWSGTLVIHPNGQVNIMGPAITGEYLNISGSYIP